MYILVTFRHGQRWRSSQ